MLQSEIEAALVDPEREPPDLEGVPGWRRLRDGAPHPEDLRDIVDAVLKVTRPERVRPGGHRRIGHPALRNLLRLPLEVLKRHLTETSGIAETQSLATRDARAEWKWATVGLGAANTLAISGYNNDAVSRA